MSAVYIFAWMLLDICCISAQFHLYMGYFGHDFHFETTTTTEATTANTTIKAKTMASDKDKTTYSHCKSSESDWLCEETKDCCLEGWTLIDETCYLFEKNQYKPLWAVEAYCKRQNASIFVPDSFEELKKILEHISHGSDTWIGIRKENQKLPSTDVYGHMDMSTLNWNNSPYVDEYANLPMSYCDAGEPVRLFPCGMPLNFICERSPEPEPFAVDVSSDQKLARTARLFEVDVTPDPKLRGEEEMKSWHPEIPDGDDDRIVPNVEMRKYQIDEDTKRIFFEQLLLNRTEAGEDERDDIIRQIHWQYLVQKNRLNWNRDAYEEKLKKLREGTRNLGIEIKSIEMKLEKEIALYETLVETLKNCKKTFCAALARVKKERFLKSVTIE